MFSYYSNQNTMSTPNKITITNPTAQRTKQLTRLTVLTLTVLTVLTAMPTNSNAAAINAAKMSSPTQSSPNIETVLPASTEDAVLSNSQPAVLQQLIESISTGGQRVRRRRLRKRQTYLSILAKTDTAKTTTLEWENPCGYEREQDATPNTFTIPKSRKKELRKEVLSSLRHMLRTEISTINNLHVINVADISEWRRHHNINYRFLPTLNRTAKIDLHHSLQLQFNLTHWHHAVQKFVASFADLGVKQYRWDMNKQQPPSNITHELNSLLISARRTLCNLESAILTLNSTAEIRTISRVEMDKELNFYSKDLKSVTESGVNIIDLLFVKHRYSKYVHRMWQKVRPKKTQTTRKQNRATAKSTANSYSDESSSNSHWLDMSALEGYDASVA